MYDIDINKLKEQFGFADGKVMQFNTGAYMPLFPYTTHIADYSSEDIMGTVLCHLDGKRPHGSGFDSLFSQMASSIHVGNSDASLKDEFKQALYKLYYDKEKGTYRPLNIRFIEQNYKDKNKLALFLSDILVDRGTLREAIDGAVLKGGSNVLESFVLSKLDMIPLQEQERRHYKRVVEFLSPLFRKDFEYVISSPELIREYMWLLFDFYYFMYMAQSCLQLSRFSEGDRNHVRPLYFCLEWEKASSVRPCYDKGWRSVSK